MLCSNCGFLLWCVYQALGISQFRKGIIGSLSNHVRKIGCDSANHKSESHSRFPEASLSY